MTQDDKWMMQYNQMMEFMKTHHRRPSKHRIEEHDMLNWFKYTKKQVAKGSLTATRTELFAHLLEVADGCRRKNQYG